MAHGRLKKSTQMNTKQHVVFLLYQCDGCTCFCAFGRCFTVPRKLSRGPQKHCRSQVENHCSTSNCFKVTLF